MSHHGNNPFNEMEEEFLKNIEKFNLDDLKKEPTRTLSNLLSGQKDEGRNPYLPPSEQLGATGTFPDGKIDDSDEGGIKFGMAISGNNLIINFGKKPINWIGFTKDEAKNLAEYILKKIEEIK